MAEVKWIRFYVDMFDKHKIKKLRRLPGGNDILLVWVMLLAMAGKCNAGGRIYITESVPFTEEDLADELKFSTDTIKLAVKAFEELDMIAFNDGFIELVGWEEHQNEDGLAKIREDTRKRVAKCREKKRLEASDVTSNVTVTLRNAIEEEGDKEKEIHSLIHSTREDIRLKYFGGTLGGGVVMMSDEQFSNLCDVLSLDEIDKYMGIVRDCELSGKHFKNKSHYQAILDMVAKDRKVKCKSTSEV